MGGGAGSRLRLAGEKASDWKEESPNPNLRAPKKPIHNSYD